MNRKHFINFISITLLLAACSEAMPHTPAITKPAQISPIPSPTSSEAPPPTPIEFDYPLPLELLTPENITEIEHLYDLGQGFILGTALSYDKQTVAIQTAKAIYLYESSTLEQKAFIDISEAQDYSKWDWIDTKPLAFSPDGNYLAFSIDERVYLWDIPANQLLKGSRSIGTIPDWEPVGIEFSPKSGRILIRTEGFLTSCDGIGTNFALYKFNGTLLFDRYSCGRPYNNYYRFTQDDKLYLFLDNILPLAEPNEVYIFDVIVGNLLESSIINAIEWMNDLDHTNYLNSDDFFYDVSLNGKLLASMEYSNDKLVTRILDAETRELIDTTDGKIEFIKLDSSDFAWQEKILTNPYYEGVCDFQYHRYENYIEITSTQETAILLFTRLDKFLSLELWNLRNCSVEKEVSFIASNQPTFSPDGRWVAVSNGFDINILDVVDGKIHFTAPGSIHKSPQDIFIFNNDGTRLITSTKGQAPLNSEQLYPGFQLQIWDTNTGQLINKIDTEYSLLKEIIASPHNEIIITKDKEGTAVWNITTGNMLSTILDSHFAFGQNKTIWVPNYGDLYQHDLISGRVIQTVALPYFSIEDIVSNNSKTRIFATTRYEEGGAQFLTIFDATTGQILKEMEPPLERGWMQVSDLPNDNIMLSHIGSETANFLDFNLEQSISSIPYKRNMVFSPNGEFIAFIDGFPLHIWSATTGDYLGNVRLHSKISHITFSPDGRLIAITGKDGWVELWGVPEE